ncbi:MAG: hypothetical protein OSB44_10555 [Verrucomicrobiales bacterium]|nr:hypothetical protein [Verrucomicrobiales bacterium]
MKIASVLSTLIALLIGVAGGYLIGQQGGGDQDAGAKKSQSGETANTNTGSLAGASKSSSQSGKKTNTSTEGAGSNLITEAKKLMRSGDVSEAMKMILNSPGSIGRMEALLDFVKELDSDEVELALAEVRGMGRGGDMFMSMSLLMSRYAEIDPEKALGFVGKSSGMERGMGTSSILRTWASKDPKAAADYLTKNMLKDGGDDWMMRRTAASVASEWAKQDTNAALAWAKGLPDEVKGDALGNIIEQITTDDPLKAAEVAMGFEGEQQGRALRTIADQWSRNEPEQALKWAEALTGEERVGVMEEALENWVRKDTESTVAYLDKMEASERDSIMKEVVEQWARVGGDATADAAKWVASQDDGKGKVDATGEVVGQWMRSDPEAASEWLGAQPVGDARDRGVAALLRDRSVREDPSAAVAWADTISNDEMRGEQVERSARSWLASDRAAALEYLETSESLSADQKTKLIELPADQLQRGNDFRGRGRRPF